ncbi:MAG: hypothetical protein BWY85_00212 [Firmicutes bacterium ADurb.Bin506]|nr:MAG: hypothetical protein BWY85_00212 [Firmicutes bacterium ADurb.Bin506]
MPKLDLAGVLDIYATLDAVKVALENPIHRYRAAAMRRKLADTCEPMIEMQRDLQKIIPPEFIEKRTALLQQYARKGPDGRPVIASDQYVIDTDQRPLFDAALDALREEFQEALDKHEAEVEKINKALREDVEYPELPYKFQLSWFSSAVRQEWLETLLDLIVDDSEETEAKPAPAAKGKKKATA